MSRKRFTDRISIHTAILLNTFNRILKTMLVNFLMALFGFALGFSWVYVKVRGDTDVAAVNYRIKQLNDMLERQREIDNEIDECIKAIRVNLYKHGFHDYK